MKSLPISHILWVLLSFFLVIRCELELVSDEDLEKLIVQERFVITLFWPEENACEECDEAESLLSAVREDLVDSLGAWVVKSKSALLAANFTSQKGKPKIVFYKQTTPMLYDGPLNEEVVLDTFLENQEVVVQQLDDNSFEHLTQAASGATTGDWFVMFYRDDCGSCTKLQARWEFIATQLKGRVNLATCNINGGGILTGRRFQVDTVPSFLFFHHGKVYHYDIPNEDSNAFKDFALGWYKNTAAKNVPSPQTPFDELVDRCVFLLQENPVIVSIGTFAALVTFIIAAVVLLRSGQQAEPGTKTKKKGKTKTN